MTSNINNYRTIYESLAISDIVTNAAESGNGATGSTGATGAAGDRFLSSTIAPTAIAPIVGNSISLTIGNNLAYITGNSVIVINSAASTQYLEGIVSSYNKTTGVITLTVVYINTPFTSSAAIYNINIIINIA